MSLLSPVVHAKMSSAAVTVILLVLIAASEALHRLPLSAHPVEADPRQKRDVASVGLFQVKRFHHVAKFRIGDDPRDFTVEPDTGSSCLVLDSSKCSFCGNHTKFQCAQESNYTIQIAYQTGEGEGRFCADTITVGGLTVEDQQFLLLESGDHYVINFPYDGLLGMGFRQNGWGFRSVTKEFPYVPYQTTFEPLTLIENLLDQELIDNGAFSFYFTSEGSEGSQLILGGSDPKLYSGNMTYASILRNQAKWKVPLEGFSLGGVDIVGKNYDVVLLDTGTSLIWIPRDYSLLVMLAIIEMAPSVKISTFSLQADTGYLFMVPKQDVHLLKPIEISVADQVFTLQVEDYVHPLERTGYYQLDVVMYPSQYWVLGKTFFQKVYTEFDMENLRIGFAASKQKHELVDTETKEDC